MFQRVLQGALAGLLATGPMTAVMLVGHRRMPWYERYALPPRQITMKAARSVGVRKHLRDSEATALTWAAHFGYGGAMGALYSLAARKTPRTTDGMLIGLAVWAGNYLGMLPALNILRPATQHPARRSLLMIAAHLVWGLSFAWILQSVRNAPRRMH